MDKNKRRNKKSLFRIRNLFLLIILLLLLLFLDGPFGLGTGFLPLSYDDGGVEPVVLTTEIPDSTEDSISTMKVLIRINDRSIYVDDVLMTIDAFESYIADIDPETVFTLKDDQANNTVFEAVEKMLVDAGVVYGVE